MDKGMKSWALKVQFGTKLRSAWTQVASCNQTADLLGRSQMEKKSGKDDRFVISLTWLRYVARRPVIPTADCAYSLISTFHRRIHVFIHYFHDTPKPNVMPISADASTSSCLRGSFLHSVLFKITDQCAVSQLRRGSGSSPAQGETHHRSQDCPDYLRECVVARRCTVVRLCPPMQ